MKKLFTLLTLLVAIVTGAWAETETMNLALAKGSTPAPSIGAWLSSGGAFDGTGYKLSNDNEYVGWNIASAEKTFTAVKFNGYINSTNTSKNWAFQFSTNGGTTWSSEVTQANDGNKSYHEIEVTVSIPEGANAIRIIRKAGTSSYVSGITLTLAEASSDTRTNIAGEWSDATPEFDNAATEIAIPSFSIKTPNVPATAYSIAYEKVSGDNVTVDATNGITAIDTNTPGESVVKATITVLNETDYRASTTEYICTIKVKAPKGTLTTASNYTWNFSSSNWSSFSEISEATINDNLEVLADGSNKASLSSSSATISGTTYTKAFNFGQVKPGSRQLHIKVAGHSKITVYAKGGSSRKVKITKDSKDGESLGEKDASSSTATTYEFNYDGTTDADLYIFNSGSNGMYFYAIKVEPLISDPEFTITPTEIEVGSTATIAGPEGLAYNAVIKEGAATDVVSIEGATISALKAGTTTVTISSEATSAYNAYSHDFEITVTGVKKETAMAFTNPTTTVVLNGTVQNVATLTGVPEGATITYASSDETVATVAADGTVTGKKIGGPAMITASYAGNDEYKASEASYEISVVAPALVAVDNKVWNGNDFLTYFGIGNKGKKDITSATWVDNLELVGTSDNVLTVKDNGSTSQTTPDFDGGFRVRITTNDVSTADAHARYVHFIVKPNTKITAYAIRTSGNGGTFALATGSIDNEVASHEFTDGGGIETIDYIYTGSENADVYAYATVNGAQFVAFRVAPLVEVTISDAGAASFSSTQAIDFAGSEVTAYQATAKSESYVHLEEITKLPAGAGAIIKAPAGTYKVAVANCVTPALTDNLLVGTGENTFKVTTADYGKVYKYVKASGVVGFQKAKVDWTCQAGHAYLKLSEVQAREFIGILGEEVVTGIDAIENGTIDNDAPAYNLAGQKVGKGYKGIVIINGKKVVK